MELSSLALFKEEQQKPPKADMLFIKINIKPNRPVSLRLRKETKVQGAGGGRTVGRGSIRERWSLLIHVPLQAVSFGHSIIQSFG